MTPRASSRRFLWHVIGLVVALILTCLVLLAYRQPDFMLQLSGLSLC